MKTKDFDYYLPEELIAQTPLDAGEFAAFRAEYSTKLSERV